MFVLPRHVHVHELSCVACWTCSVWGGRVQRTRSHTYYKTDNRYQRPILRKQPPILRKLVLQATQDSSWNVPGKYKNENGEKSNLKNAILWTAKLGAANFQTGGGAKSALALNWIDLERVWHCKSWSWHPPEFKNVCKYGVAIHIEGSRSLWRKKYPSGGLRSSNWLWSQLENLTRLNLVSFTNPLASGSGLVERTLSKVGF